METAVANYDDAFAAFQAAADSLQGEGKPILKFNKGRWLLGQDDEILEPDTEIPANIAEAEWGWMFWREGKPEDRRMVRIATGQRPALRAELGQDDQELWETDKEGKPIDPWAKTFEIPARELEGDQREVTIAGGSRGFEGAFKKLLSQFGAQMRLNQGKIPVICLGAGHYKHPEYGLTDVPVLSIVRWIDPPADDVDGEIEAESTAADDDVAEDAPKTNGKKKARF